MPKFSVMFRDTVVEERTGCVTIEAEDLDSANRKADDLDFDEIVSGGHTSDWQTEQIDYTPWEVIEVEEVEDGNDPLGGAR